MPPRTGHRRRAPDPHPQPAAGASTSPPSAPAVLSFLKESAGAATWTARDAAAVLNVAEPTAGAALATLEAAGYVEPAGKGRWRTTVQGLAISGAKAPRFARASVDHAVSALVERARERRVRRMVVFGDFLGRADKLQPAEIGVEMDPFDPAAVRDLKARSPMLNVQRLEPWMLERSHRQLLP